ncbi:hypothetical protein DITRI_Ditri08aG0104600 [Diplodiscus trichospermus]
MERRDSDLFRANPGGSARSGSSRKHCFFRINSSNVNPILEDDDIFQAKQEDLEECFSLMNLNNNPSPFIGSDVNLQKMRIQSAAESFGGHSNSRGSSVGVMSPSANFPRTPIGNDFDLFNLPRSQSFAKLPYSCPRRLINNPDLQCWDHTNACPHRMINNPDLQCWDHTNTWAVNGLESKNFSSNFLSSMYNHSIVYPQQLSKYSSLEELKGRVCSLAKDQHGCRFLQRQLDREKNIEMIFMEVKDELHDLMVHQFANYLIQKLFEVGNQEQRTELLLVLVSYEQRFVDVCTDMHGSKTVQKFMERIVSQEQKCVLLSVLKPIACTLTNNIHGHHLIEQCLSKFSNEDTKHIVGEIVQHCLDIATDKSGCCVLQQCLAHAKAEDRERLLAEITANAFILSEHPYGNYVVQYVLGMRVPHFISRMIVQLGGSYVTLSMNKYGSNVVEKCLKDAGEEHRARIIAEIIHDPDFLKVLQDPYGNYVVQSALHVSKGELHNTLVEFIQQHYPFLHSHPFGKKVLARTKLRKNRV